MATGPPDLIDCVDDQLDPDPLSALLLGTRHCAWITLPRRDPIAAIAEQVGDSAADPIRQTRMVEFWVGANSSRTAAINPYAGAIVQATLRPLRTVPVRPVSPNVGTPTACARRVSPPSSTVPAWRPA